MLKQPTKFIKGGKGVGGGGGGPSHESRASFPSNHELGYFTNHGWKKAVFTCHALIFDQITRHAKPFTTFHGFPVQ